METLPQRVDHQRVKLSRRRVLGGLSALPLLALGACGGDDGDEPAPPAAAATTTPTSAATATAAASSAASPAGTARPSATTPASIAAYYPPATGEWERADAQKTGWSPAGLEKLTSLVGANKSATFMMLAQGRVLVESYFGPATAATALDVASVQKSVVSTLLGMAREKGLLTLDDPVAKYLPPGWSRATPAEEAAITIRHLMTHSSGLDPETLKKVTAPGAKFDYNTDAYQKLRPLLEKATGKSINEVTRTWILDPIAAGASAKWVTRSEKDATGAVQWGLELTARDMARFGLMSLRRGRWQAGQLINQAWYDEAWAPSRVNTEYGLLWWLLGKSRPKVKDAPDDWVAALGARDQKIYVIPSLDLVMTRQGLAPGEESDAASKFDDVLIKAIVAARA